MWEVAEPYVKDWMAGELGPLSRGADALVLGLRALAQLPRVFRQLVAQIPPEGAAPPSAAFPALTEPEVRVSARVRLNWLVVPLLAAGAGLLWAVERLTASS